MQNQENQVQHCTEAKTKMQTTDGSIRNHSKEVEVTKKRESSKPNVDAHDDVDNNEKAVDSSDLQVATASPLALDDVHKPDDDSNPQTDLQKNEKCAEDLMETEVSCSILNGSDAACSGEDQIDAA